MGDDGFARGHRVSRVLSVAVPIALFLVWWGLSGDRGEVVATSEVTAVIEQLEGRTCLVRLDSGERVRVLRPQGAVQGMHLRMRRLEYEDGELRFEVLGRDAAPAAAGQDAG